MLKKLLIVNFVILSIFAKQEYSFNYLDTEIIIASGNLIDQPVDAIVNAANKRLIGSAGVAKVIQDAAGPDLITCIEVRFRLWCTDPAKWDCIEEAIRCSAGYAVITPSYNLEKKGINHIIHAVGSNLAIKEEAENKEKLLASAYIESLKLAIGIGFDIKTIAFPAISAAIFGYDIKLSAPIVIDSVLDFIKDNPGKLKKIYFVFYKNPSAIKLYNDLLTQKLN